MGYAIVGIVLDRILQGFNCIVGMALTNLDLTPIDQSLSIVDVTFQDFIIQLASFIQTSF